MLHTLWCVELHFTITLLLRRRALWFPQSWNRGIGWLKRKLFFNAEYDIISLKCCFRVEEEHMSGEAAWREANLGSTTSPLHRMSPSPTNVSMAKQLPMTLSSSAKKWRNSTLTPQYKAEQLPNNLYVSGGLLFFKFCQHSVDWKRKNTRNDHVLSKSHVRNKESPKIKMEKKEFGKK